MFSTLADLRTNYRLALLLSEFKKRHLAEKAASKGGFSFDKTRDPKIMHVPCVNKVFFKSAEFALALRTMA